MHVAAPEGAQTQPAKPAGQPVSLRAAAAANGVSTAVRSLERASVRGRAPAAVQRPERTG